MPRTKRKVNSIVKTKVISARVTEVVHELLHQQAEDAGMTLSEFAAQMLMKGRVNTSYVFYVHPDEIEAITREFAAIGNNLNQIAAAANRLAAIAWRDDVDASLLDQLCRELIEDETRTRPAINEAIQAVTARMDRSRLERRKDQGQGGEREDDDA